MTVRNTLAKFTQRRGLTLYRLAKDTALPYGTVHRLARDPAIIPTGSVMDAICSAYEVQPSEFLEWTSDATPAPNVQSSESQAVYSMPSQLGSVHDTTAGEGQWLTVEDAYRIAQSRGCEASLSTFRRWARGNKQYPDGNPKALSRWGFKRDRSRISESATAKNPDRFLLSTKQKGNQGNA